MLELLEKKQQHIYHSTSVTKVKNWMSSKKGLLLALCILAFSSTCFAQDIIVTKDSKKIKAKVIRVDLDKVTYKNFDDKEGASHTILKKDVASILYEDGEVETFVQDTKAAAKPEATTPVEKQRPATNNNSSNYNSNSKPVTVKENQGAVTTENVRKTRWGIKGGINIATVVLSDDKNSESMESVAGGVVGVTLESSITPELFFHSGLEVSMKGFVSEIKTTAVYVLLPTTIGYKLNVGKGWKLEPRVGLYLAYGIGGSTKNAKGGSGSAKTFGDKILNPFDLGFLGGIFLDNGSIVVGIHGEAGLIDVKGDNLILSGGAKNAKTSNASITLGYLF